MASWFIGLPVTPGAWLAAVGEPPPAVRRLHPDDLHLTVAFLGAVSEDAARAGWDALRWGLPPREVTLGALVPMGSPRRPSAFAALLVDGRAEVEAAIGLAREPCFAAAGSRREERPPKAHLTLARPARGASDLERRDAERWAAAIDLGRPAVRLDRIALYTSSEDRSLPGTPRYRVVLSTAHGALVDPHASLAPAGTPDPRRRLR